MTEKIGRLRRERLHEALQDQIKKYIIERGFQPGAPLPSEAELARALGVSRPSLREAMRALETLGAVDIRHGAGTFVGQFTLEPMTNGLSFQIQIDLQLGGTRALLELLDVREALECGLVSRVAGSLPPHQIERLQRIIERMEALAARQEYFAEEDWEFHKTLYETLDNRLLLQVLRAYWDVFDRVRDELSGQTDSPVTTASDHLQILRSVESGDQVAAVAAMSRHFDGIKRWIEGTRPNEVIPHGRNGGSPGARSTDRDGGATVMLPPPRGKPDSRRQGGW